MTATRTAHRLALTGVFALLLSLTPLTPSSAQVTDDGTVLQLSGATAIDYSIAWSQLAYPQATIDAGDGPSSVLIGRNDLFADNLASGVLQGAGAGAPLLLTSGTSLTSGTLNELNRLDGSNDVDTVTILGGPDAVSPAVESAIEGAGFATRRLQGETRVETAVAVAQQVSSDTVIIARAYPATEPTQAFADSLAAGGWAADENWPVLLTQTDVLTASTAAQLQAGGYTRAKVVGGTEAVSADTFAQIQAIIPNIQRISGPTRDETAVAIANARGFISANAAPVIVVDGFRSDSWADGFSAAAVSGAQGYPILLSNGGQLSPATADFVGASTAFANHLSDVVGVCGPSTSDAACEDLADALGATVVQYDADATVTTTVTLNRSSATAGAAVTGTVTDPASVSSLSVSGCGLNNTTATVDGNGRFTFTIPASQPPGACTLRFTVTRSGQATTTVDVDFTVTAAGTTTADPDLLSAALDTTTNQVTYTFDATLATVTNSRLRAYLPDGTPLVPSGSTISGATVAAQFTDAVDTATVATITDAAVTDTSGRTSYAASAPLNSAAGAPATTSEPDLQTVNNIRTQSVILLPNAIVLDFVFDEPVLNSSTSNPAFGDIDATKFFMIGTGGTVYTGDSVTAVSGDNRRVSIRFDIVVATSSITRGGVQADAVEDVDAPAAVDGLPPSAGAGNVLQTEPRTGTPAVAGTADRTDDPDLTSVAVAGTDVVTFAFDETVNTPAAAPTTFRVYNAQGVETSSLAATRTNTTTFTVTFPAGAVAAAVGASVPAGAVTATDDSAPNPPHELALPQGTQTSGGTALPDLSSVTVEFDVAGENAVVYRFDAALPSAYSAPRSDFGLIDAAGNRSEPAGSGTIGSDRTTVTFSRRGTATNGFTEGAAAAAVIGNVAQISAPAPPAKPVFPEADAPVTRP